MNNVSVCVVAESAGDNHVASDVLRIVDHVDELRCGFAAGAL